MIKIKCVGYVSKRKITKDFETIFLKDFANKLLTVWRNNKILFKESPPDVLIYNYFEQSFPCIELKEYSDTKPISRGILDPCISKMICKLIFEDSGEEFDSSLLGGGEWPFIIVYETEYGYFYNITR